MLVHYHKGCQKSLFVKGVSGVTELGSQGDCTGCTTWEKNLCKTSSSITKDNSLNSAKPLGFVPKTCPYPPHTWRRTPCLVQLDTWRHVCFQDKSSDRFWSGASLTPQGVDSRYVPFLFSFSFFPFARKRIHIYTNCDLRLPFVIPLHHTTH